MCLQAAAADAGCMSFIVKLWNVALEDVEVMRNLLELLKHMVSDSARAQKAFCLQVHNVLPHPLSNSIACMGLLAVHTLHQLGICTSHT